MSVSLTVRAGKPCVELEDHKGEVFAYRIQVIVNNAERLAVRLTKLGHPDEPTYLVQIGRTPTGVMWHVCNCMDYQCRKRRVGERCKHLQVCHDPDFRQLLAMLGQVAQTAVAQETRP